MLKIGKTRTTRSRDEQSRALFISRLKKTDSLTERLVKRIVDSKEYDSMTLGQLTSLQVLLFCLLPLVQVVEEPAGKPDEDDKSKTVAEPLGIPDHTHGHSCGERKSNV
jgi:hypothetical protein